MKTILFDLDGTLLPMDQDIFTKTYFYYLAKHMANYGYESEKLIQTIWAGTKAMVKNNGSRTNEEAFWDCFSKCYDEKHLEDKRYFEDFYREDFCQAQKATGIDTSSKKVISLLKEKGYNLILATNPIFPLIATEQRIAWAGLNKEDFSLITTYENSTYCKPNPKYYEEIIQKMNLNPSDCIMVGNDAVEDIAASYTGMKVFLITNNLLNEDKVDIEKVPKGSFDDFIEWCNL